MRFAASTVLVAVIAVATGCGGGDETPDRAGEPVIADPGPVHVHGLGVNPSDGALFIATHTGLFRAPEGVQRAVRVGERYQDTMGFTVVGPDRFLGSGHPDGRDDLPPFLGLIESGDAGRNWRAVSLQGDADFHVLEAAGSRVWGFGSDFESRRERLLVSGDGGRRWQERGAPEPLISLAIDPAASRRAVASGAAALHATVDEGRTWTRLDGAPGLLAWEAPERLFRVAADGGVALSDDTGRTWRRVGEVPGEPAAFEAAGDDLYVALHDGTILRSGDRGRS